MAEKTLEGFPVRLSFRKIFLICLVLVGSWPGTFCTAVPAAEFKVTKVYDGDTVKAETPELVIYIALLGIDAPEVASRPEEKGQPFGEEAKDFLSKLVLNKIVVIKGYGTQPYPDKNIISVIYREGININLEMVKWGLAEAHRESLPGGFDIEPYVRAEKGARDAGRGMWSLGDRYLSPKEWRKRQSHRSVP